MRFKRIFTFSLLLVLMAVLSLPTQAQGDNDLEYGDSALGFLSPYDGVSAAYKEAGALSSYLGNAAMLASRSSAGILVVIEEGMFTREKNLGSLFVEPPWTVGKGAFSLSLGYTYLDFKHMEGKRLNNLFDDRSIGLDIDFDLKSHVVLLSSSYGILENLDIGIIVPYLFLEGKGKTRLDNVGEVTSYSERTSGIGDVLLRLKYNPYARDETFLTFGFDVSLPTGDKKEFHGMGDPGYRVRALFAKKAFERFYPSLELAYFWSGVQDSFPLAPDPGFKTSDFNAFEYKLSIPYRVTDYWTTSAELIGSYTRIFHNQLDLGLTQKLSLSRDFVIQGGVRIPLDENGLRTGIFPNVGLEYRF
jgi:hypothetical protein